MVEEMGDGYINNQKVKEHLNVNFLAQNWYK